MQRATLRTELAVENKLIATSSAQQDIAVADLSYWKERLAGWTPIPLLRNRSGAEKLDGARAHESLCLEPHLCDQIRRLARFEQLTPAIVLFAGLVVLVRRYTQQDDTAVALQIHGPSPDSLDPLVNVTLVRTQFSSNVSIREMLRQVHDRVQEAQEHGRTPFEQVMKSICADHAAAAPVLFAWKDHVPRNVEMAGTDAEATPVPSAMSAFDLAVSVQNDENEIHVVVEYSAEAYDREAIAQILSHYSQILASFVSDSNATVGLLDLLGPDERRRILDEWNDTAVDVGNATLPELFEAQVASVPEAVAAVFGEKSLSYHELNIRANQLAHHLIRQGIGPEDIVAVAMPASIEMIVGLLGILKAGAAYLPMDPDYPDQRLSFLLEDSKPACVIATTAAAQGVPKSGRLLILDSPETVSLLASSRASNPQQKERTFPLGLENAAYIIYTSGSTGAPKGVVVNHRELSNYLSWAGRMYESELGIGAPVNTPLVFDATVTGLYLPLIAGKKVVLLPENGQIEALAELLAKGDEFTLVKLTPAHLQALEALLGPRVSAVRARRFVVGGEALTSSTAGFWRKHAPHVRIVNEYGPTEAVVGCCVFMSWVPEPSRSEPFRLAGRLQISGSTFWIGISSPCRWA